MSDMPANVTSRRALLSSIAVVGVIALQGCATTAPSRSGIAARDPELDASAQTALQQLQAQNEGARTLAREAKAILIFPDMARGGLLVGAQHGKGALMVDGRVTGYFDSTGLSFGLQAGVQEYAYALFFMTDEALDYLRRSQGWELGAGPTVVVADEGVAGQITTTTMREGIYAFIWGQRGLMAGMGLEGTKITPVGTVAPA
jgi:lipid-binding SYLF domain-containing protein